MTSFYGDDANENKVATKDGVKLAKTSATVKLPNVVQTERDAFLSKNNKIANERPVVISYNYYIPEDATLDEKFAKLQALMTEYEKGSRSTLRKEYKELLSELTTNTKQLEDLQKEAKGIEIRLGKLLEERVTLEKQLDIATKKLEKISKDKKTTPEALKLAEEAFEKEKKRIEDRKSEIEKEELKLEDRENKISKEKIPLLEKQAEILYKQRELGKEVRKVKDPILKEMDQLILETENELKQYRKGSIHYNPYLAKRYEIALSELKSLRTWLDKKDTISEEYNREFLKNKCLIVTERLAEAKRELKRLADIAAALASKTTKPGSYPLVIFVPGVNPVPKLISSPVIKRQYGDVPIVISYKFRANEEEELKQLSEDLGRALREYKKKKKEEETSDAGKRHKELVSDIKRILAQRKLPEWLAEKIAFEVGSYIADIAGNDMLDFMRPPYLNSATA